MANHGEIVEEYNRQRAHFSGKSVDELLAMTDGKNECEFLFAIEMAIQQKEERVGFNNLSDEERIVLAIEGLEREVNNGGYSQFFINSSGQYAPIIVDALGRIGCPKVSALTRRAIEAIHPAAWTPGDIAAAVASYAEVERSRWVKDPGSILMKRSPIDEQETHDAITEALDQCDQMFYQASEVIGGQLVEFIKTNKDSIHP
ncbi:MAG TPA: DUF4375 domain-containing protein [Terracidiphilus sp.]|nr:DUF4375 domain-containing protein [Terracidiphilus sp.]